ncbi:uncharacterized protein LOC116179040 [Photinus pyralis]|uniref:uncharacterized protein LOC116179040 n=1 Tax=Photinus pyralis TaxID=7054 RepID=UPI0012675380|nr:uncharacterized protein LOC116179040 [Photinus pyralis]
MKVIFVMVFIFYLENFVAVPIEDNYNDLNEEGRLHHRKKKKPCQNGHGRTFFDWHYSYINVFNTFLTDCDGGYYPIKPQGIHNGGGFPGHHQHGGGLPGHHQHGGGFPGNHHHGGGLFGPHYQSNVNKDGPFGLGLFSWPNLGLFGSNNNKPKPQDTVSEPAQVEEPSTESNDYEDEKPVNEDDHDDVALDRYQNSKDVTNFNPSKIVKRVNKGFDNFFKPFFDLFRK